jgi:hypothetical protein
VHRSTYVNTAHLLQLPYMLSYRSELGIKMFTNSRPKNDLSLLCMHNFFRLILLPLGGAEGMWLYIRVGSLNTNYPIM